MEQILFQVLAKLIVSYLKKAIKLAKRNKAPKLQQEKTEAFMTEFYEESIQVTYMDIDPEYGITDQVSWVVGQLMKGVHDLYIPKFYKEYVEVMMEAFNLYPDLPQRVEDAMPPECFIPEVKQEWQIADSLTLLAIGFYHCEKHGNGEYWTSYLSILQFIPSTLKERGIQLESLDPLDCYKIVEELLVIVEELGILNIETLNNKIWVLKEWYGIKEYTTSCSVKPWPYEFNVLNLAKSEKKQEVEDSNTDLYGIELEFYHSNHTFKDLSPLLGIGIFKEDSTVDGEFVTLPFNYEDMVTALTERIVALDKLLSGNLDKDLSEVGMHVHVSRKHLVPGQIGRMVYLMNMKDNRDFWSEIAGRELRINQFASFWPLNYNLRTLPPLGEDCDKEAHEELHLRNTVLNLKKKHTVEFRLFSSPTTSVGVFAYLKLVKDVVEFTRRGGCDLQVFLSKYPCWK